MPAILWAGVGVVVTHLWRRYRTRMICHSMGRIHPLALSAQDAIFARIEVLYNGRPVSNVLQNAGTTDLTNVEINAFFNDGTIRPPRAGVRDEERLKATAG